MTTPINFVGMAELDNADDLEECFTTDDLEETVKKPEEKDVGIWDSGCRRTVAGQEWLTRYIGLLEEKGYKTEYEAKRQRFKFGNQGTLESDKCWLLPVELYGVRGVLRVHEVPGACPLLISEDSMSELGVALHFGSKKIDLTTLGIFGQKLEFSAKTGHPIVHLLPKERNVYIGADMEDHFTANAECDTVSRRQRTTTLEDMYDEDWQDIEEAHYNVVKRGVKKRLQNLTTMAEKAEEEVTARKTHFRPLKLLEIFTWTMMMTTTAATLGWEVMEPVTLESGWDVSRPRDQRRCLDYIDRERPDLVVVAWPCTYFSAMQNLSLKKPGYPEYLAVKQKEHEVFIRFALQVARKQKAAGRHYGGKPLVFRSMEDATWIAIAGRVLNCQDPYVCLEFARPGDGDEHPKIDKVGCHRQTGGKRIVQNVHQRSRSQTH